jgi:nitrate/nitrite-specific signal transduction histidine kinase
MDDAERIRKEADRMERENEQPAARRSSLNEEVRRVDARITSSAPPGEQTLGGRVAAAHGEKGRIRSEQLQLEEQTEQLRNLYWTVSSLHLAEKREEVFAVVHDVVANLIGCESLALYLPDADDLMQLALQIGADAPHTLPQSAMASRALGTRELWLAQTQREVTLLPWEGSLSACVALISRNQIAGVLLLFELLPPKACLDERDCEILELLARHLGRALESHALRSEP